MKLKEIAERIDKSPENEDQWFGIDAIAYDLGINQHIDVEQTRLRAYWIGNWYCTDSWVGFRMYFLDDKPVAVSTQTGRKCNEEFEWFGPDAVKTVREFLLSLVAEEQTVTYGDLEQDIGEFYKVRFNAEVLDWKKARYQGLSFKLLEKIKEKPDYGIDTKIKINLPDGSEKIIDVHDLDFPFHII